MAEFNQKIADAETPDLNKSLEFKTLDKRHLQLHSSDNLQASVPPSTDGGTIEGTVQD